MKLRWFLSGTVREATEMCDSIGKMMNSQRDLLSPEAINALESAQRDTRRAIDDHSSDEILRKKMEELEAAANNHLRPYPHSEWRENVEVFLVAIAVAMAIRTFFLQPFKIPTGSMQPTLYGVEYESLKASATQPEKPIPNLAGRIWDACVHGMFYHHLVAEADGELVGVSRTKTFLRFINRQQLIMAYNINGQIVEKPHTMWFSPDEDQNFFTRAGLYTGKGFKKGEDVIRLAEVSGDHLFVDRVTYNFRKPERGEIIVFKTKGIENPQMKQDQFYIKRLVALPNENVSIGDDQHVRINGVRLDASTPHFGNVYTFDPNNYQLNHYFGHVNETTTQKLFKAGLIQSYQVPVPYFPDQDTIFHVPADRYMVMGDNTLNSWDSRSWGPFPCQNVIGKSFFVYWPISNHGESRFGWGHTAR